MAGIRRDPASSKALASRRSTAIVSLMTIGHFLQPARRLTPEAGQQCRGQRSRGDEDSRQEERCPGFQCITPVTRPSSREKRCAGGKAAGWSLKETVAIRDGTAQLDPKLASLLAVAREIAGNTGYVVDATWQAAREAGWSDAELAELFAHVAANMFTNYFNHYVQTEPDLPAAPGLEGWSPRA